MSQAPQSAENRVEGLDRGPVDGHEGGSLAGPASRVPLDDASHHPSAGRAHQGAEEGGAGGRGCHAPSMHWDTHEAWRRGSREIVVIIIIIAVVIIISVVRILPPAVALVVGAGVEAALVAGGQVVGIWVVNAVVARELVILYDSVVTVPRMHPHFPSSWAPPLCPLILLLLLFHLLLLLLYHLLLLLLFFLFLVNDGERVGKMLGGNILLSFVQRLIFSAGRVGWQLFNGRSSVWGLFVGQSLA